MRVMRILHLLTVALSIGNAFGRGGNGNGNGGGGNPWPTFEAQEGLEECPSEIEERHYNIDVQVEKLPDACTEQQLEVIGWLIEDVVSDCEESLPEYKGEVWKTIMCPLPVVTEIDEEDTSRSLRAQQALVETGQSLHRRLQRRKRYTYRGMGTCRRCKKANRDRFLATGVDANTICEAAEMTLIQKDIAVTSAKSSDHALGEVLRGVKGRLGMKKRVVNIIQRANDAAGRVKNESSLAIAASESSLKQCQEAQNHASFHALRRSMRHVEAASSAAKIAAERAKDALSELINVKKDMLEMFPSMQSFLDPRQSHRMLPGKSGSDSGGGSDSGSDSDSDDDECNCEIHDLRLVDADTNEDIVGALDCNPVNECYNGATRFNIRAKFKNSNRDKVFFQMEGPEAMGTVSRWDDMKPFTLWGDDGVELPPGDYTITAWALYDNRHSDLFIKTFTVADDSVETMTTAATSTTTVPDVTETQTSSPENPQEAATSTTQEIDAFPVQDKDDCFHLVDADTNLDIEGAPLDCSPVNECYNGATEFNIRASFGNDEAVDRVRIEMNGPMGSFRIWKSVAPFSIWGGRNGNFLGVELRPGEYNVTAWAFDGNGQSWACNKQFTVAGGTTTTTTTTTPPTTTTTTMSTTSVPAAVATTQASASEDQETTMSTTTSATSATQVRDSPAPTTTTMQEPPPGIAPEGTRGDKYLGYLVEYMEQSTSECDSVGLAINNKALAMEALDQATTELSEIWSMAATSGYPKNLRIISITRNANATWEEIKEAAHAVDEATEQCESYCQVSLAAESRGYGRKAEKALEVSLQVADIACEFASQARTGLNDLAKEKGEMEKLVALLNYQYDPGMQMVEEQVLEQEEELVEMVEHVQDEIQAVAIAIEETADESTQESLGREREALEEEEVELEELLDANQEIVEKQIELQEEVFVEEISPDYTQEEVLNIVLMSYDKETVHADANWDTSNVATGSKEEWYGNFCQCVVDEVPKRLKRIYNTTSGGCIEENTRRNDILVVVNLTEVPTKEDLESTEDCF